MPTPTPTPIATPWLALGLAVGALLAEVPVGDDDFVVVAGELLVELLTLAVYVAEGSIVVTTVPAFKVKTADGSEQLHPLNP